MNPIFNGRLYIGTAAIPNIDAYPGAYKLTASFYDNSEDFTGNNIQVNHVIADANSTLFKIRAYPNPSVVNVTLYIDNIDPDISGAPVVGNAMVFQTTSNYQFPIYSTEQNGISEYLKTKLANYASEKLDNITYGVQSSQPQAGYGLQMVDGIMEIDPAIVPDLTANNNTFEGTITANGLDIIGPTGASGPAVNIVGGIDVDSLTINNVPAGSQGLEGPQGNYGPNSILNIQTNSIATPASLVETNLHSFTLSANTLNAVGSIVQVHSWGNINSTNVPILNFYFGGSKIFSTTGITSSYELSFAGTQGPQGPISYDIGLKIVKTGIGTQRVYIENSNAIFGSGNISDYYDTNFNETQPLQIKFTGTNTVAEAGDLSEDGFEVTYPAQVVFGAQGLIGPQGLQGIGFQGLIGETGPQGQFGGPTGPQGNPGFGTVLNIQANSISTPASLVETDLHDFTLPTNTLNAVGSVVRVHSWGNYNNYNVPVLKFYFGGQQIFSTSGVTPNSYELSLNSGTQGAQGLVPYDIDLKIVKTGIGMQRIFVNNSNLIFGNGVILDYYDTTFDETQPLQIKFTGTNTTAEVGDLEEDGFEVTYPAQAVFGATGPQGAFDGPIGPTGPTGAQGSTGLKGAQGSTGLQGFSGINGIDGATGPQGNTGVNGTQGSKGPQGTNGNAGITGPQGPQGPNSIGAQGPQGNTGVAFVTAIKSGDTTRTSQTESDDPDLQVTLTTGTWMMDWCLLLISAASSDSFKIQPNMDSGNYDNFVGNLGGLNSYGFNGVMYEAPGLGVVSAYVSVYTFRGYLRVTSPGVFSIQWASNTGGSITMKAKSALVCQKIV